MPRYKDLEIITKINYKSPHNYFDHKIILILMRKVNISIIYKKINNTILISYNLTFLLKKKFFQLYYIRKQKFVMNYT